MRISQVLLSGLAGAGLLTATHETVRRTVPKAPRMDRLGMEALRKVIAKVDGKQPSAEKLFLYTMAGDVIANALFYSLGGVNSRNVVWRSMVLGLAAGVGAVLLPEPMGLDPKPGARTVPTQLMTVALYTLGGLTTGLVLKLFAKRQKPQAPVQTLVF